MSQHDVALVASMLDVCRGNWYLKVNPKTLDLTDGRQCVLGQAYGGFGIGFSFFIREVWLTGRHDLIHASHRAFCSEPGHLSYWTQEINKRRLADAIKATEKKVARKLALAAAICGAPAHRMSKRWDFEGTGEADDYPGEFGDIPNHVPAEWSETVPA